ncbi:MAG: hypothetical protein M3P00_11425 [Gemmatimonadota bacterium]|nr:hypothetical protein [Gemmatimonadota bacterium]
MSARAFRFTADRPRDWAGRYKRVSGYTTTLHVRRVDGHWWPVVEWADGDEVATCTMSDSKDVVSLVDAVNAGKAALGASPGGAFLVNEFGRVLVPASERTRARVFSVGLCSGALCFHNAFEPGTAFDLYDDKGLKPGAPWRRPYVGMPHNLSRSGELYFWHEDGSGACMLHPQEQDAALIDALRSLRPYGAVRFLVGLGGVVITKVPPLWEPRYVGRVDLATWFEQEV